jgi:hypothetical protein
MDVIPIMVYEDRTDDVAPLYAYANVSMQVTATKDSPEIFFGHFGYNLFPTNSVYKEITVSLLLTREFSPLAVHDRAPYITLCVMDVPYRHALCVTFIITACWGLSFSLYFGRMAYVNRAF